MAGRRGVAHDFASVSTAGSDPARSRARVRHPGSETFDGLRAKGDGRGRGGLFAGQVDKTRPLEVEFRTMRPLAPLFLAVGAALPWLSLRLSGFHGTPMAEAALAGMAILGAAFILSWAAELARLEISAHLAVAVLAFIAVLPEYAVDIYFAWQAGQDPAYAHYAVANMTGANRLLIGLGWSAVVLTFWWRSRRRVLTLGKHDRLELGALALATVYAIVIPCKANLSLLDTVVLIAVFLIYIRAAAAQAVEEPELLGPAAALSELPVSWRRLTTVGMFVFAAVAILLSAEPFAEGLVGTGKLLGIDEFFLVQWLAPLASEAPEFIVAILFALQGRANLGIRTMISSKVNQWTLLIGMLPLAYAISSGGLQPLPMDARQVGEVALTVAQSAFAIVVLAKFTFSVWSAAALAVLFISQLFLPSLHGLFTGIYAALSLGIILADPRRLLTLGPSMAALFSGKEPGGAPRDEGRGGREDGTA
ncbi:MAG: sodium:calcium antiporter [Bacillota bacterium]